MGFVLKNQYRYFVPLTFQSSQLPVCVFFNPIAIGVLVASLLIDATLILFIHFQNRHGAPTPPMYTETLPGDKLLALIIPSLTETMAGSYYCSASYASTEIIEARVDIQTFGEFRLFILKDTIEFFQRGFPSN